MTTLPSCSVRLRNVACNSAIIASSAAGMDARKNRVGAWWEGRFRLAYQLAARKARRLVACFTSWETLMLNSRIIGWFGILALCVIQTACVECANPLVAPDKAEIDKDLFGAWKSTDPK